MTKNLSIAVIIPCYNEEVTVGKVVNDFKSVLPDSIIYVCDNNSSDKTAERAKDAGAIVVHEKRQGKAHAVRRLFREVEADYYIMVDGDDTYDTSVAPDILRLAIDGSYDLVNCVRNEVDEDSNAYRPGHKFGNRLLTGTVKIIFGSLVEDVLSGYKVIYLPFLVNQRYGLSVFLINAILTGGLLNMNKKLAVQKLLLLGLTILIAEFIITGI